MLKITGRPLTAMVLGDSNRVRERETFAITGFPIGMVLGLNAVTHRAMIAAVTPIVIPQLSGQNLERKALTRLTAPYTVFQLDATAYPGNSGSLSCRKRPGGHHKQSFHLRNQGVRAPEAEWNHLQDLLKKIRIE